MEKNKYSTIDFTHVLTARLLAGLASVLFVGSVLYASAAMADDKLKSPKPVGRDTDGRSLNEDPAQKNAQKGATSSAKAELDDHDVLIDDDRNDDEFLKRHAGIDDAEDYNEEDEQE